jgi:hypothetical protein
MLLSKTNLAYLLTVVVILLLGSWVVNWYRLSKAITPVVCTQEAKICPDGSSVGRAGPLCEFVACPEAKPLAITIYCSANQCVPQELPAGAGSLVKNCFRSLAECQAVGSVCSTPESCALATTTASSGLKAFVDQKQNIEYKYPASLNTTYVQAQAWPPKVVVEERAFVCKENLKNIDPATPLTTNKTLEGLNFCVRSLAEGAAGSTYTTYDYQVLINTKLVTINFVLRTPQCLNYDNPQQNACLAEEKNFSADDLATQIAKSLVFSAKPTDQIKIDNLTSGQIIKSPLVVKGQARGSWYFEAVFPVAILDGNGQEIARTQAKAQSSWTTTDFVPFTATIDFKAPTTASGTLVFMKDNPSGLPINDAKFETPVSFK